METSAAADAGASTGTGAAFTLANLLILSTAVAGLWLFIRRGWYRLDQVPNRPPAFSAPAGIGLFLGAMIIGQIGVHAGAAALGIDAQQRLELRDVALLGLSRYAGEAAIVAAFAILLFRASTPQPDRRAGVVASLLMGAGALVLFWPVTISLAWLINLIVHYIAGALPDPIAHETLALLMAADRTVWFFILITIALVIAPVFEEVLYRGVLQEALIRFDLPRWYAIGATSVIFAFMHIAAAPSSAALSALLAVLFVLSLGFGWVYEKTGRLAAPIAMHILFNAGNLGAALLTA